MKSLLSLLGHEYFKTQVSGLGLALISAFLPTTVGVSYWFQVTGLVVGAIMFVWPIVAFVWTALRDTSAALKIFYACCATLVFGIWTMAWWITPQPIPIAPIPSPSPTAPRFLSRMDRFIFGCDVPPPSEERAIRHQQEMSQFKNDIDVWGDATGVTYTVTDIRGGTRISVEATTLEAKRRLLGYPATKATIEIRRIGQQEIVTVFLDLPQIYRFLSFMAPLSSSDTDEVQHTIEKFVGAPYGGCHLF